MYIHPVLTPVTESLSHYRTALLSSKRLPPQASYRHHSLYGQRIPAPHTALRRQAHAIDYLSPHPPLIIEREKRVRLRVSEAGSGKASGCMTQEFRTSKYEQSPVFSTKNSATASAPSVSALVETFSPRQGNLAVLHPTIEFLSWRILRLPHYRPQSNNMSHHFRIKQFDLRTSTQCGDIGLTSSVLSFADDWIRHDSPHQKHGGRVNICTIHERIDMA